MGRKSFMGPAISGLAREFSTITPRPVVPIPDVPGNRAPQLGIPQAQRGPARDWSPQMGVAVVPDGFTRRSVFAGERTDPFVNPGGWNGGGGGLSAVGGEWSTLDGMNDFIAQAATSTGVPPNLIKAMLAREGAFGTDKNVVGLRGEHVYAFNGIFESTAASYGIDFNRMVQDDAYAVWAMGRVLQGIKENNPELGTWDNVAKYYFAGPNWNNPNWGDETGENTVENYAYGPTGVITRMNYLNSLGGGTGGGGWSGDWSNFGPGAAVYDWGEFNTPSDNGFYGYGRDYGLNGTNHTGLDITGGWNTTYTSPVAGTVTCAGTGNGAGADGGGCAAFNTMDGKGGAGRIEVQLDNGAVLIFGHSQGSFVRPGQRINAGDALGTIGWANSNHIHLEARVRDPSTPSGWKIIDPREVLGSSWSGNSNGGTPMPQTNRLGPDNAGWGRWRF
jgi:murein DD-endopeptidase MepM/ murein hydrolase activator NlpD